MSSRLDQEREKKLQPERLEYAKKQIEALGYVVTVEDATRISFTFKDHKIILFPYSGWHSGKTITDGRGIDKLLKQIK